MNMKKILRLVSVQLWTVISDTLSIGKTGKNKSKLIYGGVAVFVVIMSSVSLLYSFMIGTGLKFFNSLELLPTMMMSATCVIILFTTMFKVKGTIFGFRDYDLLMSLPVSTGTVVACRLIILYALNFMFTAIMIIPMVIAYGILALPDPMFYVISLIIMFFIPLIPIVMASVIGTVIAYIASKFKRGNFLNIIFSMGILVIIIAMSFTMEDKGEKLVDIGRTMTEQVQRIYPLAGMFTDAVVRYDIGAFLLFLLISLTAFALYTVIVKLIFKRTNTLLLTGKSRKSYKLGQLKASSPFKALYIKELKRYFSSTIYVLNTGFGVVILTLATVAANFVDLNKILGDSQATISISKAGPLFICFTIVMTCTTMASISLEGKNLWIIKSMPLSPKNIYLSKIAVNLTVLLPALIDTIIIGIALGMGPWEILTMLLAVVACSVFIALYGLLINLLMPNFNWTAEVVVIKQSPACMITIFSSMLLVGLLALFIVFIPSAALAYLGYFVLLTLIDIALYLILMTYGKKRYYAL